MQFLKILFWCLLAFLAALFTLGNWTTVSIHLWGGMVAEVNLPLLLLVTFLIGFLPTLAYQHAIRWRLRQRLATAERQATDYRAAALQPTGEAGAPLPRVFADEAVASAPDPLPMPQVEIAPVSPPETPPAELGVVPPTPAPRRSRAKPASAAPADPMPLADPGTVRPDAPEDKLL